MNEVSYQLKGINLQVAVDMGVWQSRVCDIREQLSPERNGVFPGGRFFGDDF